MLLRDRPANVTGTVGRLDRPSRPTSGGDAGRSSRRPGSRRGRRVERLVDARGAPLEAEKPYDVARVERRISQTRGSSALSTAQPSRFVMRTTVPLTSASSSSVSMPCRPRWSALTLVTTLTSFAVVPDPAQEDAAARRLEHRDVDPGSGQDRDGASEPVQSPASTSSPVDVDAVRVRHAHAAPGRRDRCAR